MSKNNIISTNKAKLQLTIKGGKAIPGNIAAILGQKGVKFMDFLKKFNSVIAEDKDIEDGATIAVTLSIFTYENNKKELSFSYHKNESTSSLIKKCTINGEITEEDIKKIAKKKIHDTNCYGEDLKAAINTIKGSVKSHHLKIVGGKQ